MKTQFSMKKNMLYLLTVLCTLCLFSACSNDDDEKTSPDESWKSLSKIYEGAETLQLTLNEGSLISGLSGRSVQIEATSAEAAIVTLKNVIPDDALLKINAVLEKNETKAASNSIVYTLSGKEEVAGGEIKVDGLFEDGILSLDITRQITSVLTGNLKLQMDEEYTRQAVVYMDVSTGILFGDMLFNGFGLKLGELIAEKVSAVNLILAENGTIGLNWTKTEETTATGIPEAITGMLQLNYMVTDEELQIAIDKGLFTNSGLMAVLDKVLSDIGIKAEDVLALLKEKGGFYILPVNYKVDEADIHFYFDKEFIVSFSEVLGELIVPLLPLDMQSQAEALKQYAPDAERINIGLTFEK